MLGQVRMMGAVIQQQLQSHTGCVKLLSPYKTVAQTVTLQQQISPITVSAADVPITVCHPLMFSVPPITVKDTVLIVLSLLYFVVERYHSVP